METPTLPKLNFDSRIPPPVGSIFSSQQNKQQQASTNNSNNSPPFSVLTTPMTTARETTTNNTDLWNWGNNDPFYNSPKNTSKNSNNNSTPFSNNNSSSSILTSYTDDTSRQVFTEKLKDFWGNDIEQDEIDEGRPNSEKLTIGLNSNHTSSNSMNTDSFFGEGLTFGKLSLNDHICNSDSNNNSPVESNNNSSSFFGFESAVQHKSDNNGFKWNSRAECFKSAINDNNGWENKNKNTSWENNNNWRSQESSNNWNNDSWNPGTFQNRNNTNSWGEPSKCSIFPSETACPKAEVNSWNNNFGNKWQNHHQNNQAQNNLNFQQNNNGFRNFNKPQMFQPSKNYQVSDFTPKMEFPSQIDHFKATGSSNQNPNHHDSTNDDASSDVSEELEILKNELGALTSGLSNPNRIHLPQRKGDGTKHKPWMNQDILEMIDIRDKLYRRMKKSPQSREALALYKKARNAVVSLTRAAKRNYAKILKNSILKCFIFGVIFSLNICEACFMRGCLFEFMVNCCVGVRLPLN